MDSEKGPSIEVKEFYQKTKYALKLRPALEKISYPRKRNRFPPQKLFSSIQVWGKKEIQEFKNFSPKKREKSIRNRLENDIFCIILADGLPFLPEIEEAAKERRVAIFSSELSQKKCREGIKQFLSQVDFEQTIISGGLLQIFGLGVFVIGDSSIGKSESALELISRGHRFVSDDVVQIKRKTSGKLIGTAPHIARYYMEIRGLGIINIKEIFGPQAICKQTEIDLAIKLEKWRQGEEYDRLGLKSPKSYKILGGKIPQINILVAPGRNIATLIEVACKVHILGEKGYHAPQEIIKELNRVMKMGTVLFF